MTATVHDNEEYNKLVEAHNQLKLDIEEIEIAIREAECKRNGDRLNDLLYERRDLLKQKLEIECRIKVIRGEREFNYYAERVREITAQMQADARKSEVHRSWLDWLMDKIGGMGLPRRVRLQAAIFLRKKTFGWIMGLLV